MKIKDTSIIFENDKEFESYAVSPTIFATPCKDGNWYYNWDWSDSYKEALNNGKKLYMKDPNSQVLKRQAVTSSFITKSVNIEEYNG